MSVATRGHLPFIKDGHFWQRVFQTVVYVISLITLIRFCREAYNHVYPLAEIGFDFRIYMDAAQAFIRGVSPYAANELELIREFTPIVFPPQIMLILPFQVWGLKAGGILFFVFNTLIAYLLFKGVFKQLNLWHPPKSLTLTPENQIWLFSLCLFFNSNSLIRSLYMGQLALVALAFLFFAMLTKSTFLRAIFLAIAVAAKYSLIPFIAVAFIIIQDWRSCLLSVVFFLGIAAAPLLFGHNLYALYQEYFLKAASLATRCGADTYCGGGDVGELLHFDFFKVDFLNTAVKSVFLLLFVISFFREFRRGFVSLNFLLFANAITLIIAYHRFYDISSLQLLLIAWLNIMLYHRWPYATSSKSWLTLGLQSAFLGILLIFSVLPFRWINILGTVLADAMGRNPWLYFESFGNYPLIFPTFGAYTFILLCYTAYCYFNGHPTVEFLLPKHSLKGSS